MLISRFFSLSPFLLSFPHDLFTILCIENINNTKHHSLELVATVGGKKKWNKMSTSWQVYMLMHVCTDSTLTYMPFFYAFLYFLQAFMDFFLDYCVTFTTLYTNMHRMTLYYTSTHSDRCPNGKTGKKVCKSTHTLSDPTKGVLCLCQFYEYMWICVPFLRTVSYFGPFFF